MPVCTGERKGPGIHLLSAAKWQCPAPANMRFREVGGRIARFLCSWCAYSSVSPTVVKQHEEKEHLKTGA